MRLQLLVSWMLSKLTKQSIKISFIIIGKLLSAHLTIYAIALARYEMALFSYENKIANLITLAESKNSKATFERIPHLQHTMLPQEPIIYNPFQNIRTLLPNYDAINIKAFKDLRSLIAVNRSNLIDLNLSYIILDGSSKFGADIHFPNSNFKDIDFKGALLNNNCFLNSSFTNVNLWKANLKKCDFSFSYFHKCELSDSDLTDSNLSGVVFFQCHIVNANLKHTNLVGADLTKLIIFSEAELNKKFKDAMCPDLEGAYYNSETIVMGSLSSKVVKLFLNKFPSTLKKSYYAPTKFPKGFDPEKHGMIDVSKL